MEYKVGDKVRIKSIDWYNEYKDKNGVVACGNYNFTEEMSKFCGQIMIICNITNFGVMYIGGNSHYWTNEMIDCLVERNGKTYPYKIGDRVILKGNNRYATITELKYNSWGNLSYYIKLDNDKDISIDYPTNLMLPYDKNFEGILIEKVDNNGLPFHEWLYHKCTIYIPNGYELKDENGNVIKATKIVFEKKI